jgi:Reverse transcriptase (RNA-dependent DNA polymerase)./Integrase core domain.
MSPDLKRLNRLWCPLPSYDIRVTSTHRCYKRRKLKVPANHIARCLVINSLNIFNVDVSSFTTSKYAAYRGLTPATISKFVDAIDPLEHFVISNLFQTQSSSEHTSSLHRELYRLKNILLDTESPGTRQSINYHTLMSKPSLLKANNVEDCQSMPIVIDTGASRSISPHRSDFMTYEDYHGSLGTISHQSAIVGKGKIKWDIIDQNGKPCVIMTEAYHVPSATIWLYSPQFHFNEHCAGRLSMTHCGVDLYLPTPNNRTSDDAVSFPFNSLSLLPLMLPSEHPYFLNALFGLPINVAHSCQPILREVPIVESFDFIAPHEEILALINEERTSNLSSAQRELRLIHNKMAHIHMKQLQKLLHHDAPLDSQLSEDHLQSPVVFRSHFRSTRTCPVPLCRACAMSKGAKVPTGSQHVHNDPAREMHLLRNHLSPGDCISCDHYVVDHRGRLYHTAGREREQDRYCGGTLFVDHASRKVFLHHQSSLRAADTILGKRLVEHQSHQYGIRIKQYHADNGTFASNEFQADCDAKSQRLTFSASNAHHQNGVAERYIGTITRLARAMLLHSALFWPGAHSLDLWPMAMDYAVWIWNHLPMDDGLSLEEKFSGQKLPNHDHLRRAHVFGCPCYVLNPKLVAGGKIPKWDPRSRQGKFVGYSKQHSSSAGLILNPRSGYISTQFHVLYDDEFASVAGCDDAERLQLEEVDWASLIVQRQGGSELAYDEGDVDLVLDHLDDSWLTQEEINAKHHEINNNPNQVIFRQPPTLERNDPVNIIVIHIQENNEGPSAIPSEIIVESSSASSTSSTNSHHTDSLTIDEARNEIAQERLSRTRSGRPVRPNSRFFNRDFVNFSTHNSAESFGNRRLRGFDFDCYQNNKLDWGNMVSYLMNESITPNGDSRRFFAEMDALQNPFSLELDDFPTFGFISKASADDNPRFEQAMNGPNAEGFWEASAKEISTLQALNTWSQVKKESWMNVISSTWAFKIKRFPDGLIRKLKARFCVRGDQQIEGVDFFDTFAPVVQWSTIRILLILSITLSLATKQVDYVSAFCQAPIADDVYIDLPRGWQTLNELGIRENFKPGHVLKLNRGLYGLRQSPRNFFHYLKENLEGVGFKQSMLDPCLFISNKVICVVYVDDCLFFSPCESDINNSIAAIKERSMDLEVEDSVEGFLGISIKRESNNDNSESISLTQTGLIDRIINALGLDANSNGISTPAPEKPLPKDSEGDPHDLGFNYASVVGMAMYLCNNSRPDFAFAVHQCARYSFSPTRKHAEYLKKLGRYLLKTRDKGLILKPMPSGDIKIDCYVDADFAGLWNSEDNQDPHCVRSRTGYVICIGGSPIIWSSKLQSEIAMSTMEAEYIAMSTACRELLPLRNLFKEIAGALNVNEDDVQAMHTTVWEDNVGALTLSNLELPRMTPRSKHIAVKYHWFRQHVSTDDGADGGIVVKKIDTKNQLADIFTKGLGPTIFARLRAKLMGW